MSYIERWLYSTNCKDIAILYIIFAIFSGLVGTGLSIIIRLELAGPSAQILQNNGQLFNVVISLHAVMMIFFMVMPLGIGFFLRGQGNWFRSIRSTRVDIGLWKTSLVKIVSVFISNEVWILVDMKCQKVQTNKLELSRLFLGNIKHYISGERKWTFIYKGDSTITDHVSLRSGCNNKIVLVEKQLLNINLKHNIVTEGTFNIVRAEMQNQINCENLNSGKLILIENNKVTAILYELILKLVLMIYIILIKYNVLNLHSYLSKFIKNEAEKYEYHGGKKREEANVWGNAQNTWRPSICNHGEKLNSQNFKHDKLNLQKRFYSVQDESLINRQESFLAWPEDISKVEEKVYAEQCKLVNLANLLGINHPKVKRYQEILARSIDFRIIAVYKLIKSNNAKTLNKIFINRNNQDLLKISLVEYLRDILYHPNKYSNKYSTIINVAKSKVLMDEIIIERLLQELILLILEPLVELTSDENSYGNRKHRSAKNAIGSLRDNLTTQNLDFVNRTENRTSSYTQKLNEEKWILNGHIKGLFENINNDWLLRSLPLPFEYLKFISLKKGNTALSGILINFTLNGLEKCVYNSIIKLTRSKERRIFIKLKDGRRTRISIALKVIRYLDVFVILCRSKHIIKKYIEPELKKYLEERGLVLLTDKTKIIRLSKPHEKLNFLGYTFQYEKEWNAKRTVMYSNHSGARAIALYPNREKLLALIKKIKNIFNKSQNLSAYQLISILNPIISGWSNYYNLGNSSHYRSYVRNALYNLCFKWASKKHPRWGKKSIAKVYFLNSIENMKNKRNVEYIKFKNVKWVFKGFVNGKSRFNSENKKIRMLVNPTNINRLLAANTYTIPKKLIGIHAYHENVNKLKDWNLKNNIKALGEYANLKEKLYRTQKGLCWLCKKDIKDPNKNMHIHHIHPIYKGGSRNKFKNLALLHKECHYGFKH